MYISKFQLLRFKRFDRIKLIESIDSIRFGQFKILSTNLDEAFFPIKFTKLWNFFSRTYMIRAGPGGRHWGLLERGQGEDYNFRRPGTAKGSETDIKIRMKSPPRRALKIPCGDNGRAPTLTRRTPTTRSWTWSKILTWFDAMTEW